MKKIQINTTQNVKVQYEIANIGERALAWLIDAIVLTILLVFLSFLCNEVILLYRVLAAIVLLSYSPLFEYFNNGRTPGKMALNLKVVNLNGDPVTFFDYLIRWSTKGLEVSITLGTLAALSSYLNKNGQRIGDIFANTTVIKHESVNRLNFSRLTELDKYADYEPEIPEITQLNESEILLMHETYTRFQKHRTVGHKEALNGLAQGLKIRLGIETKKTPEQFVKQAIKDFVILTR